MFMLDLRSPGASGGNRRARWLTGAASLLCAALGVGPHGPRSGVARGAAPGQMVHLSLWPAGQGRIEVAQSGVPVPLLDQSGDPIPVCDFLFVLEHPNPCGAVVVAGTPVTLTAVTEPDPVVPDVTLPAGFEDSLPDFPVAQPAFVRWTVFGCEGTGSCTFTPDEDFDWVGAIFTPLQLEVGISGAGTVELQRSDGTLEPDFCPDTDSPLD